MLKERSQRSWIFSRCNPSGHGAHLRIEECVLVQIQVIEYPNNFTLETHEGRTRSPCRFRSNRQFHQRKTAQKNEDREDTPKETPVHLEYRWYPQQVRIDQRVCRPASTSRAQEGRNALPCDPYRGRRTGLRIPLVSGLPTQDRLEECCVGRNTATACYQNPRT